MTSDAPAVAVETSRICQRAVRRRELRKIVPLADTTIYEMERRGEFPQRFYLTSKCVVWDLERSRTMADGSASDSLGGGCPSRAEY